MTTHQKATIGTIPYSWGDTNIRAILLSSVSPAPSVSDWVKGMWVDYRTTHIYFRGYMIPTHWSSLSLFLSIPPSLHLLSILPSHSPLQNVWRKWSSFNIRNWISLNSNIILSQSLNCCGCSHSSCILKKQTQKVEITINLTDLAKELTAHRRQYEVLPLQFPPSSPQKNTERSCWLCDPTQLPWCISNIYVRSRVTWKSRWAEHWFDIREFLVWFLFLYVDLVSRQK